MWSGHGEPGERTVTEPLWHLCRRAKGARVGSGRWEGPLARLSQVQKRPGLMGPGSLNKSGSGAQAVAAPGSGCSAASANRGLVSLHSAP